MPEETAKGTGDLASLNILTEKQQKVSPTLDEVLVYPKPVAKEVSRGSRKKGTADLPKHLSSQQVIDFLQEKEDEKEQGD